MMKVLTGDVFHQQQAVYGLEKEVRLHIHKLKAWEKATGETATEVRVFTDVLAQLGKVTQGLDRSMMAFERITDLGDALRLVDAGRQYKIGVGRKKDKREVSDVIGDLWGLDPRETMSMMDELNLKAERTIELMSIATEHAERAQMLRMDDTYQIESMASTLFSSITTQIDGLSYFLDASDVVHDRVMAQYTSLGSAALDMVDSWSRGQTQAIKATGTFFGQLIKIHKQFALFMAPFFIAEGIGHLSRLNFLQAFQAFAAAAKYAWVGGSAIAGMVPGSSGGQTTPGPMERPSSIQRTETPARQEHHYHIYAPIHGSLEDLQVTWHDETQQLVQRGLIVSGGGE